MARICFNHIRGTSDRYNIEYTKELISRRVPIYRVLVPSPVSRCCQVERILDNIYFLAEERTRHCRGAMIRAFYHLFGSDSIVRERKRQPTIYHGFAALNSFFSLALIPAPISKSNRADFSKQIQRTRLTNYYGPLERASLKD